MATCRPVYTLELTEREAQELAWVLGELTGELSVYEVYVALMDAGVPPVPPESRHEVFRNAADVLAAREE